MEKNLLLKAEIREQAGSKAAANIRKQGRIPAIIYGHKKETVPISLDTRNFIDGLHHGQRLIDVQIGKKTEKVIVKDLQYDYLGKDIIHIDLIRVNVTETVRVTVPIELKGTAKGTHEGGIVEEHTDHLEVECRVTDIPETILVSVKDMNVGDALYARDVELGDSVKLVTDPSTLLVACSIVAAAKSTEELEEEVPVAPEVIGEPKETEQEPSEKDTKSF